MRTSTALILAMAVAAAPGIVSAGSAYTVTCESPDCGFKAGVSFGGGMLRGQITGYCVACKKFVYLDYDRKAEKPKPLATVWDSSMGLHLNLYSCPSCRAPFAEIASEKALICCPACGGDKLSKKLELLFD